jgi:hypothetical protein
VKLGRPGVLRWAPARWPAEPEVERRRRVRESLVRPQWRENQRPWRMYAVYGDRSKTVHVGRLQGEETVFGALPPGILSDRSTHDFGGEPCGTIGELRVVFLARALKGELPPRERRCRTRHYAEDCRRTAATRPMIDQKVMSPEADQVVRETPFGRSTGDVK